MTTALDRPPEEAAEDTSFARGLRVFLTIADRGEIRADELSTLLDTPLSTIYRYLRTLTEFGFVERQGSGYRLGSRLHVLGAGPAVSAEELIRAAEPVLIALTEATGETAFISRRIGVAAVCLAQVPSPQALRVALEPGQAGPLHVGAVGAVLLAFAPVEVQEAALADVPGGSGVQEALARVASEAIATVVTPRKVSPMSVAIASLATRASASWTPDPPGTSASAASWTSAGAKASRTAPTAPTCSGPA